MHATHYPRTRRHPHLGPDRTLDPPQDLLPGADGADLAREYAQHGWRHGLSARRDGRYLRPRARVRTTCASGWRTDLQRGGGAGAQRRRAHTQIRLGDVLSLEGLRSAGRLNARRLAGVHREGPHSQETLGRGDASGRRAGRGGPRGTPRYARKPTPPPPTIPITGPRI